MIDKKFTMHLDPESVKGTLKSLIGDDFSEEVWTNMLFRHKEEANFALLTMHGDELMKALFSIYDVASNYPKFKTKTELEEKFHFRLDGNYFKGMRI